MIKKVIEKVRGTMKDNKDGLLETGTGVGSELLFDGIAGQIAPGIVSMRMAYKQQQSEKRISLAIADFVTRIERIETIINRLSDKELDFVADEAFQIMLDYSADEPEEEKIKLIVNGFETIIEAEILEKEVILGYYDVLKGLRMNEIQELMIHENPNLGSGRLVAEIEQVIDRSPKGKRKYTQMKGYENYINNKLVQAGLLEVGVIDGGTWNALERQNNTGYEEYKLTQFGKNFLRFFRSKQS